MRKMGKYKRLKLLLYLSLVVILSIELSACGQPANQNPAGLSTGTYELDPVFGAIYGHLGGLANAGPPISPPIKNGTVIRQYLETALLVYDSSAPISNKFQIASLGLELGIAEPPVNPPQNPNITYQDGHTIPQEFLEVYEELRPSIVGKPLTEPRFHLVRKRYEQYFENLGFYRDEKSDEVHLLPYGSWSCQQECGHSEILDSTIPEVHGQIDPAFEKFTQSYGTDFTGLALADLYMDSEGRQVQIFENMVLATDLQQGATTVQPLPISGAVNIKAEPLRPPSMAQGMYFFPVQDQLGYDIPIEIWEYIQENGGISLVGAPVTHFSQLTDVFFHQCFVNLCLTYDPSMVAGARVKPEPLGYAFKVLYYHPDETNQAAGSGLPAVAPEPVVEATLQPAPSPTIPEASPVMASGEQTNEINLRVYQRFPAVEQGQRQELQIRLEENGVPAAKKNIELHITMPDGSESVFQMVPTNLDGQTDIQLPIIEAKNGTIITYKACYTATPEIKFCDSDVFVIWNNP